MRIHVTTTDGAAETLDWLPSEYLYYNPEAEAYCLSADKRYGGNTITFGGTSMHQKAISFDVE